VLLLAFLISPARAGFVSQTIRNDTTQANDLTVQFVRGAVTSVVLSTDAGKVTGKVATDGMSATFATGDISVGPGKEPILKFEKKDQTQQVEVATSSMWSFQGVDIGSITKVGSPMGILFNTSTGQATASFFDNETFAVTYSNIQMFSDNKIANLNIDQFDVPTGTQVTGLPVSITLQPGQSMTLSFGVVNPQGYELASADAAATGTPNDLFRIESAAAVPEPASLPLLVIGILGVFGCGLGIDSMKDDLRARGAGRPACRG